jgi:hypothetical protein
MSVSRAFAVYSGLLNAGWMCGGIGADFLRFGLGWAWLFRVLAFLSILGVLVATRLKPPKTAGTSARDTPLSGGIVSVVLILSVAVFYLASAQFVTSVPLIVEGETLPLVFVGLGALDLKAGTLGGLHGGFVLALTLWQSARPGSAGSPIMLALGLLIIAASFGVLALLHYPTIPVWIVVVVAAMSLGETLSVNHMLALGSRLAGFGRSAYWIAATVGYVISGSWGMLWETWTHRGFFAVLALVCIVVGAGMLLALTRARRSP